ncbi:MAG: adenine deaminase, partial [Planctomycetia bacterium]|nr:adenine deaminase [Planctomycetia bacterium]
PLAPVELPVLQRRIRVAQGQEAGDLLLTGGQVVNVFTRRVEAVNLVIADGWIAGVGNYPWSARETLDLGGQFVLPGLIDSHMHLESTLLLPAELARLAVPRGTTTTISDSHEIGNVLGIPGIDQLIAASEGLPLDVFFMASSCVPCTSWENAGAVLGPAEVRQLLERPRVLGLAEMMDMPAVWQGEPAVLEKIRAGLAGKRVVDGHAPGMRGQHLLAYLAAGVRADHESSTIEEAREKAAGGMLVQVREGSVARNLDALLPAVVAGDLGDLWTLVTDDILPDDLRQHGHIDGLLRRVAAAGVPAVSAIRQATLVPARHYGLWDRGAAATGYRADLVVLPDLQEFRPSLVFKNGRLAARDGQFLATTQATVPAAENSIHLAPLTEAAFRLRPSGPTAPAIRLLPGQLITKSETVPVSVKDGEWTADLTRDVALLASIERHRATGLVGLGLVAGFNFRKPGALGSSVAHDSHNLVLTGTNARDMLACVRELETMQGGFVVVSDGEVRARLPLPVAGLLSVEHADVVCRQLREVRAAAQALGCELACPFGALSFLALPVIPDLKITARGVFDVNRQEFVQV